MTKKPKLEYIGLFIIILVNLLLKIPLNSQGFFAFTYDQGRDLLVVAKIIYEHNFTLIGPTTGLQGVFYGPWWYYFLSPILLVSKGDPQGVANFFGFLAVITIVLLFLLLKKLTGSLILSFCLALIASMSSSWMFGPTLIWSTSLTPILLILFFFNILHIIKRPKSSTGFFLLGVFTFLIMDSELPFGLMLTIYTLLGLFIFRKNFDKRQYLLMFSGMFLVLLPRIIFDIKNDFLITKSIISFLAEPKIHADQVTLVVRVWYRLDLYWGLFSQAFTRNNKLLGLIVIAIIGAIIFVISQNKKAWNLIKHDPILKHASIMLIFSLAFFILYPDYVWEYYLIGLPTLFIIILSKVFSYAFNVQKLIVFTKCLLFLLAVLNFNKSLISPFPKITWQGDGATYRNEKRVMDYLSLQKPQDYSFFAYSPAIFDYPFDYLIYWYAKRSLIEKPKDNQKTMFLVIREATSKKHLNSGWYGDKTRDNTQVINRKIFHGDLLLEEHLRND